MEKVHYIGNKPKYGFTKGSILASIVLSAALTLGYNYFVRADDHKSVFTEARERKKAQKAPVGEYGNVLEIMASEGFLNKHYDDIADLTAVHLPDNPRKANGLMRRCMDVIEENDNVDYSKSTKKRMFLFVKDYAETKPELAEHLGDRAKAHMEKKTLDKYVGTVEDSLVTFYNQAKKAGNKVKESDTVKKIMTKLKEAKDKIMGEIR